MAVGPAIMALGVLWLVRVPPSSVAWKLKFDDLHSYLPPGSWFVDFLPASILFGIGICITVAPLTTALMTSVPARNSGLASAINNAISRVGPQLAGALIFIFLTASFYSSLAARLPGVDVASQSFRNQVSPLNTPADTHLIAVVRDASTTSFHLAMWITGALLVAGAIVNGLWIQNHVVKTAKESTQESLAAAH